MNWIPSFPPYDNGVKPKLLSRARAGIKNDTFALGTRFMEASINPREFYFKIGSYAAQACLKLVL